MQPNKIVFEGLQANTSPNCMLSQGGEFGIQSRLLVLAMKTLFLAHPTKFAAAPMRAPEATTEMGFLRASAKLVQPPPPLVLRGKLHIWAIQVGSGRRFFSDKAEQCWTIYPKRWVFLARFFAT